MRLSELLKKAKERSKNVRELSYDEVKSLRNIDAGIHCKKLNNERDIVKRKKLFGRSGILPLHQHCSIENYFTNCSGQEIAKDFASNYINRFCSNNGQGFIFAGKTGTGKNHLAAAICNAIMKNSYSCLIITVPDLMVLMRSCYGKDPEMKENVFLKKMRQFDLLVIDEIGLQRGSDNEKIILNQIIDSRANRIKPTGILTNLDSSGLNCLLGDRIMRRMNINNGEWIPFNWEIYAK